MPAKSRFFSFFFLILLFGLLDLAVFLGVSMLSIHVFHSEVWSLFLSSFAVLVIAFVAAVVLDRQTILNLFISASDRSLAGTASFASIKDINNLLQRKNTPKLGPIDLSGLQPSALISIEEAIANLKSQAPSLARWFEDSAANGTLLIKKAYVHHQEDTMTPLTITLVSSQNHYQVSVHCASEGDSSRYSYIGLTMHSNRPGPGINCSDGADGDYSEATWAAIVKDIAEWEKITADLISEGKLIPVNSDSLLSVANHPSPVTNILIFAPSRSGRGKNWNPHPVKG